MTASFIKKLTIHSSSLHFENCVLFGGTGFIGTHFTRFLLANNLAKTITLADIEPPNKPLWSSTSCTALNDPRVRYVPINVGQPIQHSHLPAQTDLVLNFAAIHREPGHKPHEYFKTNLQGAENVCQWAESVGCQTIAFTSSISLYGSTEEQKNEQSTPVPMTAYGESKLAAEKIYRDWQRGGLDRKLVLIRPGVVFGPGESGNVSRLVHSIVKGYFFYADNQNTCKAGGYVKELCNAILWVLAWQQQQQQQIVLFNFSADPTPTLEEYVKAVCKVAQMQRSPLKIPYPLLLGASYPISQLAKILGLKQPIDPVRIRKLVRSNNIVPDFLLSAGYPYQYTLQQALEDWRQEKPEDWV